MLVSMVGDEHSARRCHALAAVSVARCASLSSVTAEEDYEGVSKRVARQR
jgi:hypothetical protein